MKIKFWEFEYEFDKDDAKIVIPILLLLVSLFKTDIDKTILFVTTTIYYSIYFFGKPVANIVKALIQKFRFRCPKCKSRKLILQGYQPYKSDEHHAFYLCTSCQTTSILTEGGLTA